MLTKTVEVREAQVRLDELLSWVKAGAEVILTKDETHIARLVPVDFSTTPRLPGLHAGDIWMSADFDAPLPEEFWTEQA